MESLSALKTAVPADVHFRLHGFSSDPSRRNGCICSENQTNKYLCRRTLCWQHDHSPAAHLSVHFSSQHDLIKLRSTVYWMPGQPQLHFKFTIHRLGVSCSLVPSIPRRLGCQSNQSLHLGRYRLLIRSTASCSRRSGTQPPFPSLWGCVCVCVYA